MKPIGTYLAVVRPNPFLLEDSPAARRQRKAIRRAFKRARRRRRGA